MIQNSARRGLLLGLAIMSLGLAACSGGTEFSGTWTNPEYAKQEQVDDVLVVAIAQNDTARRMFETELANALSKQGVTAWPSYEIHATMEQLPKEKAEALIAENGIEAIIVTRLLDVDRKDVYVPPTTYVSSYPSYGYPYYGSWYGYYSHGYTVTHDPGYTGRGDHLVRAVPDLRPEGRGRRDRTDGRVDRRGTSSAEVAAPEEVASLGLRKSKPPAVRAGGFSYPARPAAAQSGMRSKIVQGWASTWAWVVAMSSCPSTMA
jgi:hypothetical protein